MPCLFPNEEDALKESLDEIAEQGFIHNVLARFGMSQMSVSLPQAAR